MADNKDTNGLPKGWKREEVIRKTGVSKGKKDIKIFSPKGKVFYKKSELENYIVKNKLPYNIEQFNFSVKKQNKIDVDLAQEIISAETSNTQSSCNSTVIENSNMTTTSTPSSPFTEFLSNDEKGAVACYHEEQPLDLLNNSNVTTRDASENTPEYMDPLFQLHALTEKCIALEKSLIQEKQLNENSFHTQILKQEVDKYKVENANLQSVIKILENDKKLLEEEIKQVKSSSQHCLTCYPPLGNCTGQDNVWKTVKSSCSNITRKLNFHLECKNKFSPLSSHSSSETVDKPPSEGRKYDPNLSTNSGGKMGSEKNQEVKYSSQLIIMSDSHGKDLGHRIEHKTFTKVCAFIRPGAKFRQATYDVKPLTQDLKLNDHLLVIAGTNNIETMGINRHISDVTKLINSSQNTNLILATVPMRHDRPELDLKISIVNNKIEQLAKNYRNLQLLPLHILPRHNYTIQGIHFNKRGKAKIADMVCKILQNMEEKEKTPRPSPPSTPPSPTHNSIVTQEQLTSPPASPHTALESSTPEHPTQHPTPAKCQVQSVESENHVNSGEMCVERSCAVEEVVQSESLLVLSPPTPVSPSLNFQANLSQNSR